MMVHLCRLFSIEVVHEPLIRTPRHPSAHPRNPTKLLVCLGLDTYYLDGVNRVIIRARKDIESTDGHKNTTFRLIALLAGTLGPEIMFR